MEKNISAFSKELQQQHLKRKKQLLETFMIAGMFLISVIAWLYCFQEIRAELKSINIVRNIIIIIILRPEVTNISGDAS